ncbi:MAG: TIGR01212 family radical SAM protein [Bdellovibrionales bacterium]
MQNNEVWQGLPYHPISQHYRKVFGQKVYKIPIGVAETCPNREGFRGMKVCNFCDVWGSAAYPDLKNESLPDQIEKSRTRVLRRVNAGKFLVYFQSYTTTFSKVAALKEQIEIALSFSDVVGVVVGTRPDCVSDSLLEMLNEYAEKTYVSVEFGVQTFDEKQLLWMHRGHTAKKSIESIWRVHQKCSKVNLGIHLMFGLPNESDEQMIDTARICNELPIHNVKLHNLHVLRNTTLEGDYNRGEFHPIELDEYARRATLFLQYLDPNIAVHRLSALSSRQDELLAPKWTQKKMETYQFLLDFMNQRNAFQGQLINVLPPISGDKLEKETYAQA